MSDPIRLNASQPRLGTSTPTPATTAAPVANTVKTDTLDGFNRTMRSDAFTDALTSPALMGKWAEAMSGNRTEMKSAQHAGTGVTVLSKSSPGGSQTSAYTGPYGGAGPLGPSGASGAPSGQISGTAWSSTRDDIRGPLSQYGIFSSRGPAFVNPTNGTISSGLRVGESAAIGGFAGPSSAWGAFGPLSEVGAHGFKRNPNGDFVDAAGKLQRTVAAQYDATTATTLQLYERYNETRAKQLGKLGKQDTAFGVDGTLKGRTEMDVYKFNVDRAQVVTVNTLPTGASLERRENLDVVVFDKAGKPVFRTKSGDEASWVQLALAPGEYAVGVVRADQSSTGGEASYRLNVTGTQTQNFVFDLKDAAGQGIVSRDAPVVPSTIDRVNLSRMTAADVRMTPN